jgi:Glycosyltransferase family 92
MGPPVLADPLPGSMEMQTLFDFKRLETAAVRLRSWNKARLRRHRARSKSAAQDHRDVLCILTIVKNESLNIREWLDHYFWQGASHVFVIDNGCTDSTIQLVETHSRRRDITVYRLPRQHRQVEHYRHVYKAARIASRFRWLIIADADEFWFAKSGNGLPEALLELDDCDLVYCNWTNFGTSGHSVHPVSLRRELTQCQPALGSHNFTKWAVKTEAIADETAIRVHKVSGCRSTHTISDNERLQINHYVTQSLHYWKEVKMRRGDVFDPVNDAARNMRMFDEMEADCTVRDDRLSTLVQAFERHHCTPSEAARFVAMQPAPRDHTPPPLPPSP